MQTKHNSRWLSVFAISSVLAATTGCALHGDYIRQTHIDSLPIRMEIEEVPFYPQESHQCGPAALAIVLSRLGLQVTPDEIAPEIYTPDRKGTLQALLVSATRSHNHLAYIIHDFDSLLQEVAAGHPVVVLQNLALKWYPIWHYSVVIGYDSEKQILILRSGKVFRKETPWPVFLRTWERSEKWGLVVLPLTVLPASPDEKSYLTALLALENIHHWDAARVAYETALQKWPQSIGAIMGLGNSYYAMGDLEKAEEAFRRAIAICQACGDGYNNLAHVLAEQRCYDAAMNAARDAVRIGGPNQAIYQETVEEITRLERSSIFPQEKCDLGIK